MRHIKLKAYGGRVPVVIYWATETYTWSHVGDVVDCPDDLADMLLMPGCPLGLYEEVPS